MAAGGGQDAATSLVEEIGTVEGMDDLEEMVGRELQVRDDVGLNAA